MIWMRKCLLLVTVAAAHLGVLHCINADLYQPIAPVLSPSSNMTVLQAILIKQSENPIPEQSSPHAAFDQGKGLLRTALANSNAPPLPLRTETFFAAEDVDVTAIPQEDFAQALQKILLPVLAPLEIEFWIDINGHTVIVQCANEYCTEAISAHFQQLLGLTFQPAIKDGVIVSSRKHILIEAPSRFAL